jgi:hypothetical protein
MSVTQVSIEGITKLCNDNEEIDPKYSYICNYYSYSADSKQNGVV